MMLPAIALARAAAPRAPEWAGASLAIAMLTKPQALLVAPILALGAWRTAVDACARGRGRRRRHHGRRHLAAVCARRRACRTCGWRSDRSTRAGTSSRATRPTSGGSSTTCCERGIRFRNSAGCGAFLAPVRRIMADQHVPASVGFPNPRPFGTSLVLLTSAWSLWRICGAASDLAVHALGAAFIVHAFFVLSVGVHEHHMMLAVPLLALAAGASAILRPLFWTISLIVALNMNLFYGIGLGLGWSVPRGLLLVDLSVCAVGGQHRGARLARPGARARSAARRALSRATIRAPRDPTSRGPRRRRKSTAGTRAACASGSSDVRTTSYGRMNSCRSVL